MDAVLMLCIGIGIGAAALYFSTPRPLSAMPKPTTIGEVSDLIERLKPLARDPSSDWNGVKVTFTGASVSLNITMREGNEYTAKSATLKDAVAAIDSAKIKQALQGWSGQ